MIDPSKVVIYEANGTGDIAEVFPPKPARPAGPFALAWFRVHFRDVNSGAATLKDLTIYVDSQPEQSQEGHYDTLLWTEQGLGLNNDAGVAIDQDEIHRWMFQPNYGVRFAWTNPDTGNIGWGLEVGLLML